jgi:hypothetical protein
VTLSTELAPADPQPETHPKTTMATHTTTIRFFM